MADPGAKTATIDAWLPQTQCTRCGYPRCHDYAAAIASGEADINQCPPGGEVTVRGLATETGRPGKPVDPKFGVTAPRTEAVIDEARCIGCVMCIAACPVDAIVGAAKLMHTVIPEQCTGCELCVEPCPVDCIDMQPAMPAAPGPDWRWPEYSPHDTDRARRACEARLRRLARRSAETASRKRLRELRNTYGREQIRADIRAALARARRPDEGS